MKDDVNVNQTLYEALALLKSLLRNVKVEIKTDEIPGTFANAGQLVQVWVNLIKNAYESLAQSNIKDPTLWIKTSFKDKNLIVRIIDNGPGIPKELQSQIFQPNVTTKVGGLEFGLGLGLTIVLRIVSGHDGDIKISSKPGKTEFKILLPIR